MQKQSKAPTATIIKEDTKLLEGVWGEGGSWNQTWTTHYQLVTIEAAISINSNFITVPWIWRFSAGTMPYIHTLWDSPNELNWGKQVSSFIQRQITAALYSSLLLLFFFFKFHVLSFVANFFFLFFGFVFFVCFLICHCCSYFCICFVFFFFVLFLLVFSQIWKIWKKK